MAMLFPAVEPVVPGAEPVPFNRGSASALHAELRRAAVFLRDEGGRRQRSAERWLGDWQGRFRQDFDRASADLGARMDSVAGECDESLKVLVAVWDQANAEQWSRNRTHLLTAAGAPPPWGLPL